MTSHRFHINKDYLRRVASSHPNSPLRCDCDAILPTTNLEVDVVHLAHRCTWIAYISTTCEECGESETIVEARASMDYPRWRFDWDDDYYDDMGA